MPDRIRARSDITGELVEAPAAGGESWLCIFHGPAGATATAWITQDGADQMAVELEAEARRKKKRGRCEVLPAES